MKPESGGKGPAHVVPVVGAPSTASEKLQVSPVTVAGGDPWVNASVTVIPVRSVVPVLRMMKDRPVVPSGSVTAVAAVLASLPAASFL